MTFIKSIFTKHMIIPGRSIAGMVAMLLGCTLFSQAALAVSLDDISYSSLPGSRVLVNLKFSEPLAGEPVNFTIDNPARIAIDLPDVDLNMDEASQSIGVGVAHSVNAVEAAGRTRVVINLVRSVPYTMAIEGDTLTVSLGAGASENSTIASSPATRFSSSSSSMSTAPGILDVDFRRGSDGEGRIQVTLSDPSVGINLSQEGGEIIVEFINANLPSNLDRRYDVVDFATPVKEIDTSPTTGGARMVISTTTDQYDHLAYQSDNLFTIEVQPLSEEEQEAMRQERFGFEGERLSLNFQNIEVRAVLSLIADFTGNNLVATDTVGGNVTLRLRNVPWDQALDIILKSKGLGIRHNGNVMLVAPQAEIAARERLEMESQQQVEELAPLRTEFIQINYAEAASLRSLIQSGGEASLLSERGTVSVDDRTNTLIVQDVSASLEAIRSMVTRLDVPIRQVLIESRIVNADESFTKDLGVKFGISKQTRPITPGENHLTVGGTRSGGIVDSAGFGSTGFIAEGGNDGLLVNLPVVGATSSIGLLAGKVGSALLQLELSALLAEGRGEDIANPKVITADQTDALIKAGVQIPYQEASSSGATSVSFQDAVLELAVKPQITPDDRILLDLAVKQDTQGQIVSGIPVINIRQVETSVMVNNGETVVLGGIYQEIERDQLDKTPFFGDLPVLGFLFKKRREESTKQELLIFVTPTILNDEMTL